MNGKSIGMTMFFGIYLNRKAFIKKFSLSFILNSDLCPIIVNTSNKSFIAEIRALCSKKRGNYFKNLNLYLYVKNASNIVIYSELANVSGETQIWKYFEFEQFRTNGRNLKAKRRGTFFNERNL